MKIKHLIAGLSLFISTLAFAQPSALEPLESWQKRRPNWADDTTDLAYATTRCGVLYSVIGGVFMHSPKTDDDKKRGMDATVRGMKLVLIGDLLAKEVGWADEKRSQRVGEISKLYVDLIASNRTTHNNMFHGFIEHDWKFCIDHEKKINASLPKK